MDQEEFDDPADVSELDTMDAAVILQQLWDDSTHEAVAERDEYEEDEGEAMNTRRMRNSPSTSKVRSRRSLASFPD